MRTSLLFTLTSRFNNELCLCLCVCVFMCLGLCEHCPFENGILAHHRGVSDPNHFYLCLFCICLYLHRSFDNTVLAYEQNVWGPDGLCVHCASLAARPKHQFANRVHYIFRKKYSFRITPVSCRHE